MLFLLSHLFEQVHDLRTCGCRPAALHGELWSYGLIAGPSQLQSPLIANHHGLRRARIGRSRDMKQRLLYSLSYHHLIQCH